MDKLEELRNIVQCLSSNEIKDVYVKLNKYRSNFSKDTSLKLFDLIRSNNDISFKTLQDSLYTKQNISATFKLISRLVEKLFDVIIFKENIEFNEFYDKRSKDIFLLERQLLIAEILRYRGLFKLSFEKLENVILKCKHYEHYDILLYALDKKRRWVYLNINDELNLKLNIEIEHFDKVKKLLKISEIIYLKIFKFTHESFNEANKKYISVNNYKLNKYYTTTKSNQIKFYAFYTKIQQYYLKFEFEKALISIEELIEFLLEKNTLYSRLKHGNALLNLGVFNRFCFRFELSLQYILESRKFYLDQYQNNLIINEHLYLTHFYAGNIIKMKYYLNLINEECIKADYKYFDLSKFNFYISIYNFIVKDYLLSFNNLNQIDTKNESKLFNLECRIIFTLNCIESNKYDLADYAIDRLRKYFSRLNTKVGVFRNKELILKVLTKLTLFSYDFKKTQINQEKNLIKLKELSFSFSFYEYEMILFHEWFEAKVKGVPYDHTEVMKRLRKNNKSRAK